MIGILIWIGITILNSVSAIMLAVSMKTIKKELEDQREQRIKDITNLTQEHNNNFYEIVNLRQDLKDVYAEMAGAVHNPKPYRMTRTEKRNPSGQYGKVEQAAKVALKIIASELSEEDRTLENTTAVIEKMKGQLEKSKIIS